ncbi:hypothetical protein IW140_004683 [Coemansia sp. RSA 1813]|nr:hypothetical protein EV178_004752 [Coemansia sp. RSA 1646]KAJ1768931.1 hypothetical protein LPJ74_004478 [Coemansia sp. RSA 1843]KAJ2087676.1 hypothetical protein IW138_004797 [Coemansia sp. RSA 986]KAJ2212617.1 hypothetical protein EV179_004521 [Coemansia sp. RSA 487]KAJ2567041.1 hypothetical protein IW140_004683 [Coemansia sp. RSA 1813]
MERAPSRAKATNILRPSSSAQTPSYGGNVALGGTAPPGGPRFVVPTAGASIGTGGATSSGVPGMLRRPPSASQFLNQQLDLAHHTGHSADQQQLTRNGGGMIKQRASTYFENTMPMVDPSGATRSLSRSGSRAELVPGQGMQPQHQNQQLQPRSSSRAGRPGVGGASMWAGGGAPGQMGINGLFGGGFGSMGGDFGPVSPMNQRYQQMQMPMQQQQPFVNLPGSRPGSSLQVSQPARSASSAGFRSSNANTNTNTNGDSPVVVNVARGGARVIGPMRAKATSTETPSFLNPIPQSPSSALGVRIPGAAKPDKGASDEVNAHSALSNSSLGSGRSRSNSALPPTEEFMEAAEARVSRKIQDLEISNNSLMTINTQLESRVKSQREQINELKKQLQMKAPFISDPLADNEISDEALRSALKEDKVFERLISNLDHLIQDAKAALEYRSTIAAGKVISAADLNEGDSQLTIGKSAGNELGQKPTSEISASKTRGANDVASEDGEEREAKKENDSTDDTGSENDGGEGTSSADKTKDVPADTDTLPDPRDEKIQEARELVARLMVLALASQESTNQTKINSRIPMRAGSASAATSNSSRPPSALKVGLRAPVKSASTRISSFGVASESTPVRSLIASPTPPSKSASGSGRDTPAIAEKEQIIDICRKLQDIL